MYLYRKGKVLVAQSARLLLAPWTVAHQAPLSMGSSRQEHWSGLLCPPSRGSSQPRIEPRSPALQADFFFFFFLLSEPSVYRMIKNNYGRGINIPQYNILCESKRL